MDSITLKAHYDGEQIRLDEPFPLAPNTRLLVTVVPGETSEDERQAWLSASQASLARTDGENEPDYSEYLGKMPPE